MKSLTERRDMVEESHPKLSVSRQCKLLSIHRSGHYYQPKRESSYNLKLMRLIDEQYLQHPYYGVPRMTAWLRSGDHQINHKRIGRLYKLMGLEAVGPKPNTSKPFSEHQKRPYLLKGLKITRVNQVWATDITYVPMENGFMFMVAVIDLYSRYIIGWSLSNTMTAEWCSQVVDQAVKQHGKPDIVNTDQGSQFTSEVFTNTVDSLQINLSMDGKGRAIDNVFIERFWRSIKYECLYLNAFQMG